jgi:hypothetical protein
MSVYVECPRCGQGRVNTYRVVSTAEMLQVCDECEAVWPTGGDPAPTGFTNLEDELTRRGLPSGWEQLEEMEWP